MKSKRSALMLMRILSNCISFLKS
ncbi:S4 domain protein, partial [Vibrio parahaemolyticus AQ3810]